MGFIRVAWWCACALVAAGHGLSLRRAGWLDRVVLYHKNRFIEDVRKMPRVQLKASVERAPAGYADSAAWDGAAVARLVAMLRTSEAARPARRALRRIMSPSRRNYFMNTYKLFPSIDKYNYYDGSAEVEPPADLGEEVDEDSAIVVVSNPIEARLPGRYVSVRLIREVLERRAAAVRDLRTPPTTRVPFSWTTPQGGGAHEGQGSSSASPSDASPTDAASTDNASTDSTADNALTDTTAAGGGATATDTTPAPVT